MGLYLENGYIDFDFVASQRVPFTAMIGPRGTGKTYGALKWAVESGKTFCLFRRTDTELRRITSAHLSPFKKLNADMGWSIYPDTIADGVKGFFRDDDEGNQQLVCYAFALSTIADVRGFDGSDIELIIFDEFVPERHKRLIPHEAEAIKNAYETIARNRELEGREPLPMWMLSNSDDVGNPYFVSERLVNKALDMRRTGKEISVNRSRGIALYVLSSSRISEAKRSTALYRSTEDTDFVGMALDNQFGGTAGNKIKPFPLRELRPLVIYGEVCVYEHKSEPLLYVSLHKSGSPPAYGTGEADTMRFRVAYRRIWDAYIDNRVVFEDYYAEKLLTSVF